MSKSKNNNNNNEPSAEPIPDPYANEMAEKINYLFEHFRKPNGQKYSYLEVENLTQGKVHNSWLSRTASGQSPRPSLRSLKALNEVFGVDPGFWFKDLQDWLEEQEVKNNPGQDTQSQQIAMRASELSPGAKEVILDLIESFEKRFKGGEIKGKQ